MIETVDDLHLHDLPRGTRTRLWLEVAQDALGLPIRLPVLVARGRVAGKTAAITAAVHGDEVNGIPVIHRLFAQLDPARMRGDLIAVPVVNVIAFELHSRRMHEAVDLNHAFPGNASGNLGAVLAHRLLERIVHPADLLIDLHTASRGRANPLYVRADMKHPASAQMAYLQRPQIILHNPPSDGTLRGAAAEHGIPAITVEIGNPSRVQKEVARRATVGVRAVLAEHGIIPRRPVALGPPPVLCSRSRWLYTDDGGLLEVLPALVDRVQEGEPIATLTDLFGEHRRTYTAPEDGIVIGRSVDPVAATGARLLHLGALATDADELLPRVER